MADLWGRRCRMLVSLFVRAVVLMVLSSLTNFFAIGVTTLLLGLFTDLYRPASGAIMADLVQPEARARAFSLRYWAINPGAAIGLRLAGWLAPHNYFLLFLGDAAPTFGFGVVTLLFIPETRVHHPTAHATAGASRRLRVVTHLRSQFAEEAKLIQFGLLFAALMLITASVYNQADATMPLAMQANHLNESAFGTVIALNGVVIVLVSLTVNRLLEKRSAFLIMAAGALLIGSGFGMYAFATTKLAYAFGVVIWTLAEVAVAPPPATTPRDVVTARRRAPFLVATSSGCV